jgi:hypothetical protein
VSELLLSPAVLGVLGLLIGSFLNVVVHRLPAMAMRDWWRFDLADFALADPRSWRAALGAGAEPPAELAAASRAVLARLDPLEPLKRPPAPCSRPARSPSGRRGTHWSRARRWRCCWRWHGSTSRRHCCPTA